VWFFQVKENKEGDLVLMEIAPRIAGTMGMYRNLGVNFALLSLFDKQSIPTEILRNSCPITLDRCFQNKFKIDVPFSDVYVDFDDTLIINDKVNQNVVSFLYQCLNNELNIYLITKHLGDIREALHSYKISESIFKEIYHLSPDENKSDFIKKEGAIFLDDSFLERKKVSQTLGIPCFSVDMVESLINYKE
jgi:hypothetical protein